MNAACLRPLPMTGPEFAAAHTARDLSGRRATLTLTLTLADASGAPGATVTLDATLTLAYGELCARFDYPDTFHGAQELGVVGNRFPQSVNPAVVSATVHPETGDGTPSGAVSAPAAASDVWPVTYSLVTTSGTAMSDTTLCASCYADPANRRDMRERARWDDEHDPRLIWHNTTENDYVECSVCPSPDDED